MTERHTFDVVIVGGGVIGSAVAFFLAEDNAFDGTVAVVERDPTYVNGSTARSVGGVRQQFSTPENIEMSLFGAHFFREAAVRLEVAGERPEVDFNEAGYLLLASPAGLEVLRDNHALQKEKGARVVLLEPAELDRRFPWLRTDDLAGGSLGVSGEGWIDGYSLLMALKRKAQTLGVSFVRGEVVGADRNGTRVTSLKLDDGRELVAGKVVNAAGPAAAAVAGMVGIEDLPVHCRKRLVYSFECPTEILNCPLVVDPGGVYFRPESGRFVCGVSPPADQDPDCEDLVVEGDLFEDVIWPSLAHRVPAFETLRPTKPWAGHYAVNIVDRNAILGPHPEVGNFYFANGFSGHGLQQAPAVGRAIAELIVYGGYRSLDLRRFSFERFAAEKPVLERNVI